MLATSVPGRTIALALLLLLAGAAGASAAPAPLRFTVEFSADDLAFSRVQGFDRVDLPGAGHLAEPGLPQLPAEQVRVALPAGFAAVAARVVDLRAVTLPGSYSILPAQPATPLSAPATSFVGPDPSVYGRAAAYPAAPVRLLGQTDLAGQAMAVLEVVPLAFLPAAGGLRLATSITLEIDGADGYVCRDFLPARASAATREDYAARLRAMVINPDDVRPATGGSPVTGRALAPGDYDYVIISPPDFVTNYEPLADWKTQKGVPAKIVTTTWIYNEGGYSGANDAKIRAFITDANATWGAIYFVLGGDTNVVPTHWWTTPVDPYNIPEDTYFADLDDDWTVEVHVARIPARYAPTVYTIVDKALNYETNPPRIDFARRVLLLGFDLDDVSFGEDTKEYIATQYLPGSLQLTRIYDSQTTNHRTLALEALNSGQNVVNHIDHCIVNLMGLGSTHHNWNYTVADINASHNGPRQTLWYTTGCFPCSFDDNTCIAEAWVQKSGGGGQAFVGNTRYGWYNPGNPHTLSNRYDEKFFQMLYVNGHYRQGDCFTAHKNSFYPADDTYRYIFRELTLLGDPELPLWTADPESLVVAYAPTLPVGAHAYAVHVARVGGSPVANARVCLWKDGDVYQVALTDAGGGADFDPNPASEGPMLVTVTARDALAHRGAALVTGVSDAAEAAGPARSARWWPARPSPFSGATTVAYELPRSGPVSLRVFDLSGRLVRVLAQEARAAAGSHRAVWDGADAAGQPVPAGVYVCRLEAGDARLSQRLIRLR
jgi:hypothetical protein